MRKEDLLQVKCNQWMEYAYPELTRLFKFNAFQGMVFLGKYKWSIISNARKLGGLKKSILDFEFNKNNGKYSSLFIELKIENPFDKNGNVIDKGEAIEQWDTIQLLQNEGHYACFAWSFDQFKKIVTDYMENKL